MIVDSGHVDPERFPCTTAYLDRLPRGIHSHPRCEVKASIFVDQLSSLTLADEDLRALPAEVQALVDNPPPVTAWIPEVVTVTYTIALRDAFFPPPGGDAGYAEWTYERNKRLLGSRLYRALFVLVSPDRLFRNIGRRWGRIRRGSTLELLEQSPGYARLRSRYPSYLHDESVAFGMSAAFRAAAELAGAKGIDCEAPQVGERETTFVIRYRA